MNQDIIFQPIGIIKTPFKQKFGTPRQSGLVPAAEGEIQLDSHLCPEGCLEGLSGFSHIWLFFHFNQNKPGNISGKVKPPRLKGDKMGLFATRTPHRPNALGMSLVELVSVEPSHYCLRVRGIDLVDKTPILDIKPYIESYDYASNSNPGWTDEKKEFFYTVEFSKNTSEKDLKQSEKELIEQVLKRDFRDRDKDIYKTKIGRFDVHFQVKPTKIMVLDLINQVT